MAKRYRGSSEGNIGTLVRVRSRKSSQEKKRCNVQVGLPKLLEVFSIYTALMYPPAPSPVDILFVGWNPPGTQHFWNCNTDRLRMDLAWVLSQLGWNTQLDFLAEFNRRKCYFVHAVKCWPDRSWPPENVTKFCASTLLTNEIRGLHPKTLCLLGRIPHLAACTVLDGLPPVSHVKYGKGWSGTVNQMQDIITAFPNSYWNSAQKATNRECTVRALRRCLP